MTTTILPATAPPTYSVEERFHLDKEFCEQIGAKPVLWGFGLFSELVYYRTYSRNTPTGQEKWLDTVIRVVEGVMSIRKDWYRKNDIYWDDMQARITARRMAEAIYEFKMLPPGRGLWAMGTEYIYERGSMALNNCGAVDVTGNLAESASWAMDALMCGVGVGFTTHNANLPQAHIPNGRIIRNYNIPDTREGWVESVRLLIDSYFSKQAGDCCQLEFGYNNIRLKGEPLKGFGGLACGPEPLIKLHERIRQYMHSYLEGSTATRLVTDVMNAIGACVVAGNVRRSAELAIGKVDDLTFLNLKNYNTYPERQEIGWMSNNSVILSHSDEFELLPQISERIRDNGEPGIINLINIQKYARIGKKKIDRALAMNPCCEIPLENHELCNLVEVFPSRCRNVQEVWEMMHLATFYASTVSLLPSHSQSTNIVVARNRRIGVSVSGIADWIDSTSLSHVTMALREGYERVVEPTNMLLAVEARVPTSVRLTTVKPSGTISLLAGVSPGMNWPVGSHVIRRFRISETSPMVPICQAAKIPFEQDVYSDNTLCFEFPLASGKGKTRGVHQVSVWEQASLAAMLQREWADNAVSNTLTFQKSEAAQIEHVIAAFAPLVKAISLLPDQEEADNPYAQPPYERITKEKYESLRATIQEIDWSALNGVDGSEDKFCDSDVCELPV